jgi:hypothetical protein
MVSHRIFTGNAFLARDIGAGRKEESRVGTLDRPAGGAVRFFEEVLAARRRTADVAGIEWKSAAYRKVGEESNPAADGRSSGW